MQNDYEKLGAFYLGKNYDLDKAAVKDDELLLYDSKDLCTHGVCVGMTGSGKTGLCISLIEEAAIDGIPVIAIDPKGDLGNLMLTFPGLQPADFKPWVDPAEATRKGMTPDAYASKMAGVWKKGLAQWGQDGERLARLKEAADVSIYTPGSTAGLPITVLRSFDAPPAETLEDNEALQERIQSAVSGLLALLGVDADPLQSREHILLSNILHQAWTAGKSLDLPGLIQAIQKPGFDKIGVFDLESFYPSSDRFGLAMRLNNLLASPGFSTWMEGEALDIDKLMYTPEGKPRISILSIAHLSDSERMFFVTILLNELLTWMRRQAGTSSLRALLYMDEIFGYFPPTANPPSKKPMLTLLKQARAFGLGVMVATQNPVDLDYKGLSNTGTWFIGRLQTERDKLRVLDGLEGASSTAGAIFDRGRMEAILSGLGSRVFLMNNVHDNAPVVFHTRWAMSYLRGPITRTHIKKLMADKKQIAAAAVPVPGPAVAASATSAPAPAPVQVEAEAPPPPTRPVLPADINEYFLPVSEAIGDAHRLVYRPRVAVNARMHYVSAKGKLDDWLDLALLVPLPKRRPQVDWEEASFFLQKELELDHDGPEEAEFEPLPGTASNPKNYSRWQKELKSWLYQNRWLTLYSCSTLKLVSKPGEDEGTFRGRIRHELHEHRDLQVQKIKIRYEKKMQTLSDQVGRAEAKVEREQNQYKGQKLSTAINIGSTLLGALMGRKMTSSGGVGKAASAMRSAGRAGKEKDEIARAKERLEELRQRFEDMELEFQSTVTDLETSLDPEELDFDEIQVRPRKTDISFADFGLVWTPWRVNQQGIAEAVFKRPVEG